MSHSKNVHRAENLHFPCALSSRGPTLLSVGTGNSVTTEKNDDPFSTHSHAYMEILYVEKGRLTFTFNNASYEMKEKDCAIIPAGVQHREEWRPSEREYYIISLDGMPAELVYTQNTFLLRPSPQNEKLAFYVKSLVCETMEKRAHYKEIVRGLFSCAVHELYRLHSQISLDGKRQPPPASGVAELLRAYLHEHYQEEIRLAELSRFFFFSEQYLVKKFKERFGCTPKQYLLRFRIQTAGELLLKRDNPVAQIGSHVGFRSTVAFLYTFKKQLGLSPTQFREVYQANLQAGLEKCTLIG